jgi:8-amino-7-oxononanoate synthase
MHHPPRPVYSPDQRPGWTAWLRECLAEAGQAGTLRSIRGAPLPGCSWVEDGRRILNFGTNDFLDLTRHPCVVAAAEHAVRTMGSGAGAARLVSGSLPLHDQLERRLAALKGYPSALLFGSGYMANVGILASLAGPGDLVVADRLIHASLLDGIRMSGAKLFRFAHNDAEHARTLLQKNRGDFRHAFLVIESVYSMDGDIAPLPDLTVVAREYDAVMIVDEAHATGAFGVEGAGLVSRDGLQSQVQVCIGTLSKALASFGGFVACPELIRDALINFARPFLFSTAPPPASMAAALAALDLLHDEPERMTTLHTSAQHLRMMLRDDGWDTLNSASHIIPVLIGDNQRTLACAHALRSEGLWVPAIRPPTVPHGSARLRISVSYGHTSDDLNRLITSLRHWRDRA